MRGADLLFHFRPLDFWGLLCTLSGKKGEEPLLPVPLYSHVYSKCVHWNAYFLHVLCCQFINISDACVFIVTVISGQEWVLHIWWNIEENNSFQKSCVSQTYISFRAPVPLLAWHSVSSLFLSTSEHVEGPVKHLPETKHFMLLLLVLFFLMEVVHRGLNRVFSGGFLFSFFFD